MHILLGTLSPHTPLNDPTLGETILALPLWLAGATPNRDWKRCLVLHGQAVPAEALLMGVAMLKSALFVPFVAFCFAWVRRLYNARAGWAAAIALLIEPTIAAHVTPAALDVMGFEAIAVACVAWWAYFAQPTWPRVAVAGGVTGVAMCVKHTAVVLPVVALGYATFHGAFRRAPGERVVDWFRARWRHALAAIAIAVVTITICSGGFERVPRPDSVADGTLAARLFDVPWPAGRYVRSLQTAARHGEAGHPSWLLGQRNDHGSLAYFPVVATYKMPIGLWAMLGLGVASLAFVRPRFDELALVVPTVLLWALLAHGGIDIGFRHAIAPYGLMLLLSTRALLAEARWMTTAIACALAATTVDVARWFPDFVSYVNAPRRHVWMKINDSNLDWGQGLKEIRAWIDAHGKRIAGRPVAVQAFGLDYSPAATYYIGGRAAVLTRSDRPPRSGLLIVSPAYVVGLYVDADDFAFLRDARQVATIGHGANLVFDLDRLASRRRPATRPAE